MTGPRPLLGKTVVVTRALAQAADLAHMLEDLGAEVLAFPTIETVDPDDWEPADRAIRDLAIYDWLVFSSANAVDRFFGRLATHDLDARALAGTSIAAVGPATAVKCEAHGVRPDWVPDEHTGEGLLAGFVARGIGDGRKVLIPRAQEGRDVLPDGLRERGVRVDVAAVYRTVTGPGDPAVLERLRAGAVDAVTFTSPSTLRHFLKLTEEAGGRELLERTLVASIGPVTTKAAAKLGVRVDVEASPYTAAAMTEALAERVRKGEGPAGPACWGYEEPAE